MAARALNPGERSVMHFARRGKILLVDENQEDLDTCLEALCARGLEVRACHSYLQAAQYLDHEEFDFVIVDQGSPAFEGHDVVQRALHADVRKPVLVLARCHDVPCYLEAMELGALDYLEKPLSAPDIVGVVERHFPVRIAPV